MAGRGDPRPMHPDADVAEALPRVYRRVLDAIGRLERLGGRREAARLRRTAAEVYGGPWNAKSHRSLEAILARAEAVVLEHERRAATAPLRSV